LYADEAEPIENRRLQVQIGRVDTSSLPWSFSVKTDYPRQPPIKCQLARAAELPVAAHFDSVAEDQHGEVSPFKGNRSI
jgi:hypothetical protein